MWRDEFPAKMDCALALVLELHQMELDRQHEVDVRVMGGDGEELARAKGALSGQAPQDAIAGETLLAPIVIPLTNTSLPEPGQYSIDIMVDGSYARSLTFQARPVQERGRSRDERSP